MTVIFTGILLGILIIYLLSINRRPLRFPPGPISIPIIGGLYVLGKEPHKKLIKMKKKYGSIIGINVGGYRGVILNDYKLIKEAFDMPQFNNRPKLEIIAELRGNRFPGVTWASGANWIEQRKFLLKQFGRFCVGGKSMETLVLNQLQKLFEELDDQIGKPILNKQLFETAAIGSLWTVLSGNTYDHNNMEYKASVAAVNKVFTASPSIGGVYIFPWISKWFPEISLRHSFMHSHMLQHNFTKDVIKSHQADFQCGETTPKDFIEAHLEKISTTTDKNSTFFGDFGKQNLMATIDDVFRAGTETVASTLSWFIQLIILHPDVQNKLHNELDNLLGEFTPPSLDHRSSLPYLEACIMEVLRYTGIAPFAAPHETSEDVNFHNYFIPRGTLVIPNIYGVLHDPHLWENPHEFRPVRFISSDGATVVRNSALNFAFGSGKRVCPGEALAKNEIFLFVSGLLQRYNFEADPDSPSPNLESTLGATLAPKPHYMIITKRKSYN